MVEQQSFGEQRHLGRAEFQFAVMAQDHVLQESSQALREIRDGADLVIDHPHADGDMTEQLTFRAVAEAAIVCEFVNFADIVRESRRSAADRCRCPGNVLRAVSRRSTSRAHARCSPPRKA